MPQGGLISRIVFAKVPEVNDFVDSLVPQVMAVLPDY